MVTEVTQVEETVQRIKNEKASASERILIFKIRQIKASTRKKWRGNKQKSGKEARRECLQRI